MRLRIAQLKVKLPGGSRWRMRTKRAGIAPIDFKKPVDHLLSDLPQSLHTALVRKMKMVCVARLTTVALDSPIQI